MQSPDSTRLSLFDLGCLALWRRARAGRAPPAQSPVAGAPRRRAAAPLDLGTGEFGNAAYVGARLCWRLSWRWPGRRPVSGTIWLRTPS